MNKNVIIKINAYQITEGQKNHSDPVIAKGKYYFSNGCHYLFYSEYPNRAAERAAIQTGADRVNPGAAAERAANQQATSNGCISECSGNSAERVSNRIEARPGCILVKKSGSVTSQMEFNKDKDSTTKYSTPFGTFTFGIHTKDMLIRAEKGTVTIEIDYSLYSNGSILSENHIKISAKNLT